MKLVLALVLVALVSSSAIALDVTVSLDTKSEAAFQFLMNRTNVNLAAQKKAPFASLSAYVSYLLNGYVAMETQGVTAERKAAVLRKIQDAPATITAADKAVLGIP